MNMRKHEENTLIKFWVMPSVGQEETEKGNVTFANELVAVIISGERRRKPRETYKENHAGPCVSEC